VNKVLEDNSGGTLGGELKIDYGQNEATFTDLTDGKNRRDIYTFNNYGNTISVINQDDSAKYYNFPGTSGSTKNKLGLESKLQKKVGNYLSNHSAEVNGVWQAGSWNGASGSQTYTTEEKYMGNQSLKIQSNSNAGGLDFENYITVTKGKTYTLSAYVKTKDIPLQDGDYGASIFVGYYDAASTAQFVRTYIKGTNDWKRYEVTFTLPANAADSKVWVASAMIASTGTA
jgi:hypothetical protein